MVACVCVCAPVLVTHFGCPSRNNIRRQLAMQGICCFGLAIRAGSRLELCRRRCCFSRTVSLSIRPTRRFQRRRYSREVNATVCAWRMTEQFGAISIALPDVVAVMLLEFQCVGKKCGIIYCDHMPCLTRIECVRSLNHNWAADVCGALAVSRSACHGPMFTCL